MPDRWPAHHVRGREPSSVPFHGRDTHGGTDPEGSHRRPRGWHGGQRSARRYPVCDDRTSSSRRTSRVRAPTSDPVVDWTSRHVECPASIAGPGRQRSISVAGTDRGARLGHVGPPDHETKRTAEPLVIASHGNDVGHGTENPEDPSARRQDIGGRSRAARWPGSHWSRAVELTRPGADPVSCI